MVTSLQILSGLAVLATTLVTFGAGYFTAYYVQYKKEHKSLNEKSKEARA